MAPCIGAADSRQCTVRPVFLRSISFARTNTSRCFITAGSEMPNGSAICVIASPSSRARRSRMARRVGSASAANAVSSWIIIKSTISLSIACPLHRVNNRPQHPRPGGKHARAKWFDGGWGRSSSPTGTPHPASGHTSAAPDTAFRRQSRGHPPAQSAARLTMISRWPTFVKWVAMAILMRHSLSIATQPVASSLVRHPALCTPGVDAFGANLYDCLPSPVRCQRAASRSDAPLPAKSASTICPRRVPNGASARSHIHAWTAAAKAAGSLVFKTCNPA